MEIDKPPHVGIVLRPARQSFHDQQILDGHHRDAACTDCKPRRPTDCLSLEPGHADGEIHTDAGGAVPERQDEGRGNNLFDDGEQGFEGSR